MLRYQNNFLSAFLLLLFEGKFVNSCMIKTVIVMENNRKNLLLLLAFVAFLGTTIRQAEGKKIPQGTDCTRCDFEHAYDFVVGLRCFACDNFGSGETCITNPASIANGYVQCTAPNDEYCVTSRLEEESGSKYPTIVYFRNLKSFTKGRSSIFSNIQSNVLSNQRRQSNLSSRIK
jgi:hypothetical protein